MIVFYPMHAARSSIRFESFVPLVYPCSAHWGRAASMSTAAHPYLALN